LSLLVALDIPYLRVGCQTCAFVQVLAQSR
jgi:hypothetical protein